jgi:hypothetical protein
MIAKRKSKNSRTRQKEREKEQRNHRRALGLCTRCGRNKPERGRKMCGKCGQRGLENLSTHRTNRKLYGDDLARRIKDRDRSIELFNKVLQAEVFGPNPGFVNVIIRPFVYSPYSQRQERLPGLDIQLLVSSEAEAQEMFRVMRRAIEDWANGTSPYSARIDPG